MKTIITITFLLFSFLGFSQTSREEVVERDKNGQKLIVNTYTGTGNSEKLTKKTKYSSYWATCVKPTSIEYYGSYKWEMKNTGEVIGIFWGVVKTEEFDQSGVLVKTWKKTDDNSINHTYTILP